MKPKKIAILTIVAGEKYQQIWQRSEPFFNVYADKCGADLLVLKDIPDNLPSPHWAKFSIYELLKKQYDRVAFIDADIIIRPDAPDVFAMVPEDQLGIFNEGLYCPRSICIYEVKKVYNIELPKWDGKSYYNTGVMIASREHRHVFKVEEEIKPLRNSFGEQTYLNMKIIKSGVNVFRLPFKFNRMSLMDKLTGKTRLDSYFIHYAGDGDKLLEKMDRDIKLWAEDPSYKYRQKIFIWALGGLGDCICAEPTIRHMRNEVYKDADIFLMSNHHFLYHHIEGIEFHAERDFPKEDVDAVSEFYTHPSPFDKFSDFAVSYSNFCPHLMVHAVDWVSMNTINRMLPLKDREIKLTYTDDDLEKVMEIYPDPEKLILIHAGKGWETKPQPLTSLIKTPDGWTKMGDIKVGDRVCTPDGGTANVDGVYPKGKHQIFEVTFADGRRTHCTIDHLWKVYHENWIRNWKGEKVSNPWKIKSLAEIIEHPSDRPFYVPLPEPVYGTVSDLPIDPYVLGCLLGDGCFSKHQSIQFSTGDSELIKGINDKLQSGISLKKNTGSEINYRLTGLMGNKGDTYRHKLKTLALWGKLSNDKFVPNIYKNSSIEQRLELVCGLMDTDGNAAFKNGHAINFYTVSNQLALDMQYLIRSLGGLCSITSKKRIKAGMNAAILFTCHIRHDHPENLFKLSRKKERAVRIKTNIIRKCRIVDIKPLGVEEVQCISIDNANHLYITDDFIVTHNTFPVKWWQEIVDTLDSRGFKVGLIGANVTPEHGYVPVECPPNGIDFRDKLSIPQLISLIAQAPVLITNDSAPTHIAGAFDNYIILIPTCKEGDLLIPYRKGQQYYKAACLSKREIHQDQLVRSTDVSGWQTSHLPIGHTIEEYIPAAGDVIKQAVTFSMQSKKLICMDKLKEAVNE